MPVRSGVQSQRSSCYCSSAVLVDREKNPDLNGNNAAAASISRRISSSTDEVAAIPD